MAIAKMEGGGSKVVKPTPPPVVVKPTTTSKTTTTTTTSKTTSSSTVKPATTPAATVTISKPTTSTTTIAPLTSTTAKTTTNQAAQNAVSLSNTTSSTTSKASNTNILDNIVQGGKNLISNPKDTLMAVGGVALGTIGVIGSGIGEVLSGGTATPLAIPVAAFSANTVVTSAADLTNIAKGNNDKVGDVNLLKSATKGVFKGVGEGLEFLADSVSGKDIEIGNYTEKAGGIIYEGADLYLGAKGVSEGLAKIADKSYKFVQVTSLSGNMEVPVNTISKAEKIGAGADIVHTVAGWIDNGIDLISGKK